MAEKKVAVTKNAPAGKKKVSKGESYACEVCGLAVIVDEECGCEDVAFMCCGEPMKERKTMSKATK